MIPFDWEEFLEFAEEQVRRRGNPAAERSAISRAYYAAFHKAKAHFVANGQPLSFRADDHSAVARWFRSRANQSWVRIGSDLDRLRQLRRDADYEALFPDLTSEANSAVSIARRLLREIADLR
jgi:uncharacterized protein (UPF0332 family)